MLPQVRPNVLLRRSHSELSDGPIYFQRSPTKKNLVRFDARITPNRKSGFTRLGRNAMPAAGAAVFIEYEHMLPFKDLAAFA